MTQIDWNVNIRTEANYMVKGDIWVDRQGNHYGVILGGRIMVICVNGVWCRKLG